MLGRLVGREDVGLALGIVGLFSGLGVSVHIQVLRLLVDVDLDYALGYLVAMSVVAAAVVVALSLHVSLGSRG